MLEMEVYHDLLRHILNNGVRKTDRTGIGTISCFGYQTRINLQTKFPILTTKKLHFKSIVYELLWFLKGYTNIAYLKKNGISIWDEWADKEGNLGPVYGKQWRSWEGKNSIHDQMTDAIHQIKNNPDSRRIIISAWNVADIPAMALAPCHCLFQFYVNNNELSCHLYQRSADAFLGVPFNIASYALLTRMIAQVCGLQAAEFIHTFGDLHIYQNHIEQVHLQLSRNLYELPTLNINPIVKNIFDFEYDDFQLNNYQFHPSIKAPIAI